MNQTPKHLIKIMEANGWVLKRIKGSHHIYFNPERNETMPVPVHGNRDLSKGLLLGILKKLDISVADFLKY